MAVTKKFKERLIECLTDGSYRRAKGVLINNEENARCCCLGVILVVAGELEILSLPINSEIYGRFTQQLTNKELDRIGLTPSQQSQFIDANDHEDVPEGKYYPDRVVELAQALPVRWDVDDKVIEAVKALAECTDIPASEDIISLVQRAREIVKEREG